MFIAGFSKSFSRYLIHFKGLVAVRFDVFLIKDGSFMDFKAVQGNMAAFEFYDMAQSFIQILNGLAGNSAHNIHIYVFESVFYQLVIGFVKIFFTGFSAYII